MRYLPSNLLKCLYFTRGTLSQQKKETDTNTIVHLNIPRI